MKKTLLSVVLAASTVFAALPSKDAVDAVKKGDLTLFKKLVTDKEGANGSLENGKSILMYAVWEGREEIVKYLIDLGADVNAKDKEGKTALMLAVWRERLNIVKLLVVNKADKKAKNNEGLEAADIAEIAGNGEIIDYLGKN